MKQATAHKYSVH